MSARRWWTTVASALAVVACSGGGSGVPPAEMVGTWNVTRYELVSTSSSTTKVDLISLGGSATLAMKADGTYQMAMQAPGQPAESPTGTWSLSTDVLTTTQDGMAGNMQFDYTLSGSTLTLTGADSQWDFNGDGVDEPAKLNIAAVRG